MIFLFRELFRKKEVNFYVMTNVISPNEHFSLNNAKGVA